MNIIRNFRINLEKCRFSTKYIVCYCRCGIWRNSEQEPHGYAEWGAPYHHGYPKGPNLIVVGYDSHPFSPYVYVMAPTTQPGIRHGQVFKIWSRWLRITSYRYVNIHEE